MRIAYETKDFRRYEPEMVKDSDALPLRPQGYSLPNKLLQQAKIADESVTRIWTNSKGVIPASNRAFPAVPDEAHIIEATTTER